MDDLFDDLSWLGIDGDTEDLQTVDQLLTPKVSARTVARRTFINGLKKQALNQLVPELPPPDTDLYIIGNGSGAEIRNGINQFAFDFGTFIPHIVQMLGNKNCTAYVSSWTMNRYHVKALLELYDTQALTKITVVSDPYFKTREAAICNELITGLLSRGQRFLAFKNHVKCIAISAPDGRCCTVTGSANLSAQPRCEQYVLTTSPDVYQFFAVEFFEAMVNGEQSDKRRDK